MFKYKQTLQNDIKWNTDSDICLKWLTKISAYLKI